MNRSVLCRALAAAFVVVASSSAAADGVVVVRSGPVPGAPAYPVATPSPAPVYGGWTTPATGGYGSWTTPAPSGYGTWTTPPPGGYGAWTSSPGAPRASGSAAMPPLPSSVALASSPTVCDTASPWSFGAWARYWRPSVDGEVLITRGGVPGSGSVIAADDDLGLDDGDGWEVGLSVGYGRHRVFAAWEALSFAGSNRLAAPIIYRAIPFAAGERIEAELDLTYGKLGYDYALVEPSEAGDGARFGLRAGVAAWWWKYDGAIEGATTSVGRDFSHLLPIATLSGAVAFDAFRVAARASGGLVADDRYIVDLEASVGATLFGAVTIEAGWRWMNHSFHETTNEADLTMSGPFAGLTFVF